MHTCAHLKANHAKAPVPTGTQDILVGTIMATSEDVGSMAEAGMRGIVFSVLKTKNGEKYGVIFETGMFDWFSSDDIDKCMVSTGLADEALCTFSYTTDDALIAAYRSRQFRFWP